MERSSGEIEAEMTIDLVFYLWMSQYVQQNLSATNTKLFSFLALLNAYIPDSYLLMSECKQILGPPDPIHGGPPFKQRMEPFTPFIETQESNTEYVYMIHPMVAKRCLDLLARFEITRSDIVKNLMVSLCGEEVRPELVLFVRDLLTKREMGKRVQEKFSKLTEDICEESFSNAVFVLKMASEKFKNMATFPQNISRLYYIKKGMGCYEKAEEWAKKAIELAPFNSYVADTLGQVYKNQLMRKADNPERILEMADKAFKAFKEVEEKAENEVGAEMVDIATTANISHIFNNRGLFGFMQVAQITYEKLLWRHADKRSLQKLKVEVEDKFDFFEWYLTYSQPEVILLEPPYFWKVVVYCYEQYTTKKAVESLSFPGLLDLLNHGLFISKGRRAGLEEYAKTVSYLEVIRDILKTTYVANTDDVKAAKRYILSNIILSNKMPDSPHLSPVRDLQRLLLRFMDREIGHGSPEFYLLVLMLFWPEEHPQKHRQEDNLDLQQNVTFMEKAFERAKYAKYLRGRHLLPLFFLGKGRGLSKWVHKSRLDAMVEEKVNAKLSDDLDERAEKEQRINEMWRDGKVWQLPKIRDILLPVQVEPCQPPEDPLVSDKQEMLVSAGRKKITATMVVEDDAPARKTMFCYLGFTIQGPVVFKAWIPHN